MLFKKLENEEDDQPAQPVGASAALSTEDETVTEPTAQTAANTPDTEESGTHRSLMFVEDVHCKVAVNCHHTSMFTSARTCICKADSILISYY